MFTRHEYITMNHLNSSEPIARLFVICVGDGYIPYICHIHNNHNLKERRKRKGKEEDNLLSDSILNSNTDLSLPF